MNYRIEFSEQAQRVIKKLKKSNPRSKNYTTSFPNLSYTHERAQAILSH